MGGVMKKITLSLAIIVIFATSGCVTGTKTVKPSPLQQASVPVSIQQNNHTVKVITVVGSEVKAITTAEPTSLAVPTAQPAEYYSAREVIQEPVKIQYSQIANLISNLINIEEKSFDNGENGYLGISDNRLTIFEIKGGKDDIKEASIKLVYPENIDRPNAELNNAMMARFLKNAAPELQGWDVRVKEIIGKFDSLEAGMNGISKEDIELANKIIRILYDKNASYIIVTLKPQP